MLNMTTIDDIHWSKLGENGHDRLFATRTCVKWGRSILTSTIRCLHIAWAESAVRSFRFCLGRLVAQSEALGRVIVSLIIIKLGRWEQVGAGRV